MSNLEPSRSHEKAQAAISKYTHELQRNGVEPTNVSLFDEDIVLGAIRSYFGGYTPFDIESIFQSNGLYNDIVAAYCLYLRHTPESHNGAVAPAMPSGGSMESPYRGNIEVPDKVTDEIAQIDTVQRIVYQSIIYPDISLDELDKCDLSIIVATVQALERISGTPVAIEQYLYNRKLKEKHA